MIELRGYCFYILSDHFPGSVKQWQSHHNYFSTVYIYCVIIFLTTQTVVLYNIIMLQFFLNYKIVQVFLFQFHLQKKLFGCLFKLSQYSEMGWGKVKKKFFNIFSRTEFTIFEKHCCLLMYKLANIQSLATCE